MDSERRTTGFARPLRPRTLVAFSGFFLTGIVAAFVLTPPLGPWRWPFSAAFWFSWMLLAASCLATMWVDPVDPAVARCGRKGEPEVGKPWCATCKVSVRFDSKHCWDCNKCVAHFDHHCPWLNTCVGERNYGRFFVSIFSLLATATVLLTAAALLLMQILVGEGYQCSSRYCLGEDATVGLLLAVVFLYVPIWCLDFVMLVFHCWLCYKGITTYEYLRGARPKTAAAAPAAAKEADLEMSVPVSPAARSDATTKLPHKGSSCCPLRHVFKLERLQPQPQDKDGARCGSAAEKLPCCRGKETTAWPPLAGQA